MSVTLVSKQKCYEGFVSVYSHVSESLQCTMKFAVVIPPQAATRKVPVVYYLSGLTCTEQIFITKAGAPRAAAEHGIMIVCPDTSPRGVNIEGDEESWDFGKGAGFYVNATEDKWKTNYNMYTYVTEELPKVIEANFAADMSRQGIFGHSMGGHGALICALKNPGKYLSVSAFAPICHPSECAWGKKAFTGYLGPNTDAWKAYDATELVKTYAGPAVDVLVDQGTEDKFLHEKQLLPEHLVEAAQASAFKVNLRNHEGYDHSYFFITTFIDDHIKFHAAHLN